MNLKSYLAGMGHRSYDSFSTSRWARFTWRIYHQTSPRRRRTTWHTNSIIDWINIWRWGHEISSYVWINTRFTPKSINDFRFAAILNSPELLEDFSKNYERALPIALNYDHHSKALQSDITNRIIEFYFNNEAPSAAKQENITNVREIANDSKKLELWKSFIPWLIWNFSYSPTVGFWKAWICICASVWLTQNLGRRLFICSRTKELPVLLKYSAADARIITVKICSIQHEK